MKKFVLVLIAFLATSTYALEAEVITRLVKEDISQGKLISGKRSVDKLEFVDCTGNICLLNFQYFTTGCHQDYCWDLSCMGEIWFDLETIESSMVEQNCIDL